MSKRTIPNNHRANLLKNLDWTPGFADQLWEQLDNHLKSDRFCDKRNRFADLTGISYLKESYKNKKYKGKFHG